MSKWKTLAIVFMVLFILESICFIYIMKLGVEVVDNENMCAINICGNVYSDSYYYDMYEEICACYLNGDVVYSEFIG